MPVLKFELYKDPYGNAHHYWANDVPTPGCGHYDSCHILIPDPGQADITNTSVWRDFVKKLRGEYAGLKCSKCERKEADVEKERGAGPTGCDLRPDRDDQR